VSAIGLYLDWAFRDVYESLNRPVNLLFIDEMIDSGMDANGVDNALGLLKKMAREQKKNIFLISHRDELVGRVNNILQVVKENGFTTFNTDVEMVEA
jgi:ABC-type multidrug transport system ATPase subunit